MYNYNLSNEQKIQRFIIEASVASNYDLIPFFERWGLIANGDTKEKIKNMELENMQLPIWENRDKNIKYKLSIDR